MVNETHDMRIRDVAKALSLSTKTVNAMVLRNEFNGAYRLPNGKRAWRIPSSSVEAWRHKLRLASAL